MNFAFVFPGQNSQSVGMLAELAATDPIVQATFEDASAVLGYDLWELIQQGPEERLNATEFTQPAMLTAGVATWRLWHRRGGPAPGWVAGHSLGEFTALVCAEALELAPALELVAFRGKAMQEAVPRGTGAMAAILGLEDAQVEAACQQAAQGGIVEPVNFNSPGQVVIAGHRGAVERGMALAKELGAKRAVMLPMSAPSHCSLMRPAADRLRERLSAIEVAKPAVPVVHNRSVEAFDDPARIREALVEQLDHPVRWIETVRFLAAQGVTRIVECAPGKVLTGLDKRIAPELEGVAVQDSASLDAAVKGNPC